MTKILGLAIAITFALATPALANSKKLDANDVEAETPRDQIKEAISDRIFTEEEKTRIQDYFKRPKGAGEEDQSSTHSGKGKGKNKSKSGKGKSGEMPPGLAKKDELPPGLQMQLEKNGTLPPGLAKRDLPKDLEGLLPLREHGIGRYIVEQDVILLDEKSGKILDILRGAAAVGLI